MLYLIGGGPGTIRALRGHLKTALAELGLTRPVVAYVGAASADDGGFFRMIRDGLAPCGAKMHLAKLASPRASAADARKLVEGCDLVFVSGGDVEAGMRVLHERDMVKPLQKLARAGKPMFGISAGSLMLARDWVRFPGEPASTAPDEGAELFPCLGIAPVHVDAHAEEDDWSELKVLVRLLHGRGERAAVGYGLTRQGGLRVTFAGRERTPKLTPLGTPIPRLVVHRGKVAAAAPLT